MTLQLMIEMVNQAYPAAGQTEIIAIMKSVVDGFLTRTRLLTQSVNVSSTFATDLADLPDDGIALTFNDANYVINVFENLDSWDLNNLAFFEVSNVQYDGRGLMKAPAYTDAVWWIERGVTVTAGNQRDRLVVGTYTTGPVSSKAPLSSAVDIRLTGACTISSAFGWTTLSNSLPIPEEFHLGIVYGVMQKLALTRERDVRASAAFMQEYEMAVRQAIMRRNRAGVGGGYQIKTEYF